LNSPFPTASDVDGNFSLNIPKAGMVLQFSYVGMKNKELTVQGNGDSATRRTVAIQDTQTGHLSLHHVGNIRCSRFFDNFRECYPSGIGCKYAEC